jgi:hypothetical protein
MRKYKLIDGESGAQEEIEALDMYAAKTAAEKWMREGLWFPVVGTIWVRVHIIDLAAVPEGEDESEYRETVTVTIDPDEPSCSSEEGHDWQAPFEIVGGIKDNPGVWGHGGGVVIREVCMYCGCERVKDTWATDRETGEQGLESITYNPGKYAYEVEQEAFK